MYKIHPKTLFVGKKVQYFASCYSTNDLAAEIIQQKEALEGMCLITDNQLAGRGQRGSSWEALPGMNITLSVILKPTFLLASQQFKLNIAVSLAIYDLLNKQAVTGLSIKWPNDVYIGDLKMGGVLIENMLVGNHIGWTIVGVGLNINQIHFENPRATSLRIAKQGKEYDLPQLIEELAERIEERYLELRSNRAHTQKAYYLENLYRFEEWHPFSANGLTFAGRIIGVNETGKLIIETQQQTKEFDFKEVSYLMK